MISNFYIRIPFFSLLAVCFILHIIADFNLQGMLGSLKQKTWWQNNYPKDLYQNDYKTSGWIHAIFWSMFTFLPLVGSDLYFATCLWNAPVHYLVDHLKANRRSISLTTDQTIHIIQIVSTIISFKLVVTV